MPDASVSGYDHLEDPAKPAFPGRIPQVADMNRGVTRTIRRIPGRSQHRGNDTCDPEKTAPLACWERTASLCSSQILQHARESSLDAADVSTQAFSAFCVPLPGATDCLEVRGGFCLRETHSRECWQFDSN